MDDEIELPESTLHEDATTNSTKKSRGEYVKKFFLDWIELDHVFSFGNNETNEVPDEDKEFLEGRQSLIEEEEKEDELELGGNFEREETDTIYVICFKYVTELIEVIELANDENRDIKKHSKRFMVHGIALIVLSFAINLAQIALLLRLIVFYSTIQYGEEASNHGMSTMLANGSAINCGAPGFESSYCMSSGVTPSTIAPFTEFAGAVCASINESTGLSYFSESEPGRSRLFVRHQVLG